MKRYVSKSEKANRVNHDTDIYEGYAKATRGRELCERVHHSSSECRLNGKKAVTASPRLVVSVEFFWPE